MNSAMRRCARGYSLIEVIVTVAILSVGLLGLAGLQARAHTAEAESFSRAQALMLAADLADRMATNRVEARKGATSAYNTATVQGAGNASVDCSGLPSTTSGEMAVKDLCEWDQALKGVIETSGGAAVGGIAGARGCVELQLAPIQQFVVTVAWAGRGTLGSVPADRTCASAAIPTARRVVSVTVPFADLDN